MTKHNTHEMAEHNITVVQKCNGFEDKSERQKTQPAMILELPSNTNYTSLDTENFAYWPVRTSELESHDLQPQANSPSPQQEAQPATSPPAPDIDEQEALNESQAAESVAGQKGGEEDNDKLKILRDRIEGIREEKERLERLQHLRDLEEQTKQEIMEAQRRSTSRQT